MADELQGQANVLSGTVYCRVRYSVDATIWSTAGTPGLVTYNGANIADYAITADIDSSGWCTADMPAAGVGTYFYAFYLQATGAPLVTDQCISGGASIDWSGSAVMVPALRPTTAGRTLDVAATGEAGLDFNNVLSTSLITLHSLTISGATTLANVVMANNSAGTPTLSITNANAAGIAASISGGAGKVILALADGTDGSVVRMTYDDGSDDMYIKFCVSTLGYLRAIEATATKASGNTSLFDVCAVGNTVATTLLGRSMLAAATQESGFDLGLANTGGGTHHFYGSDATGSVNYTLAIGDGVNALSLNAIEGVTLAGVVTATNAGNDIRGVTLTQAFPANFAALGITAGGAISNVVLTDTLTTYTGNTPQTGDSFAIIGGTFDGYTFPEWARLLGAVLCGKASGGPSGTVFRSMDDAVDRVASVDDSNGNRTTVTLTP